MVEILIDPSSYPWLVVSCHSKSPSREFDLSKISLMFDKIYYFGDHHGIDFIEGEQYGQFLEITDVIFQTMGEYFPDTMEQVRDTRKVLGDPPEAEGGHYVYALLRAMLAYAKHEEYYFFTYPGRREDFIEFCLKYERDYLLRLKESFLLCSILECIFENEIPAFDPVKAQQQLIHFAGYKDDFQKGVLGYLKKFEGSYMLSKDQEKYLRESIARDEKRLLDFLKPENLKKYNIPKLEEAGKFILGLLTPLPLPIDVLVDVVKEFKKVRDFKNANLDFVLSLAILKQLANIGETRSLPDCIVCSLSPAEIENFTEEECHEHLTCSNLCLEHIVARLDLRKRFGLFGKQLLSAMKKFGDSSVFISTRNEEERSL